MSGRDRPEPELGSLDDLDAVDLERPVAGHGYHGTPATRGRRGMGWWWLLAAIAAVLVLVYVNRDDLRRQFPGSQTRELLNAAARAEADARWHGSADGDDALALYQRVLAGDADNDVARLGLRRVGTQLGIDAEAAIAAGDVARASQLIDQMATIGEAGDRVAELRQRLDGERSAGQDMASLLERGQSALARRRIRGDNGALHAFKQMLARDPGNAVAQRGVDDALQVLIDEAAQQITTGDLVSAQGMIDAVAAERAQHAGLPPLRQALAEASARAEAAAAQASAETQAQAEQTAAQEREQNERERITALAAADEAMRGGDLEQAVEGYRRVLALAPGDAEALDGLNLAALAALEQARDALVDSHPERAAAALALARRAEVDPDALARLEAQLADLNERLTEVLARPELDAEEQELLDALIRRARAADARGDLVEPVGDSAYDLYRQALAIDPMQEEARRGVDALPRRAQALAVHHTELGQLEHAGQALNALQAMSPLDPSLPELKRQLASAWLERGSTAVRNGAIGDARFALDQARALAPAHPGIAVLAGELSGF